MKKRFTIFLFLFALIFAGTQGQNKTVEIGLEGGPALVALHGNDVPEYHKMTVGYSGGVFLRIPFSDLLSLRIALDYERKGSVWEGQSESYKGINNENVIIHSNFNFATLPILLRISSGGKVRFFANAGPYVGYLLEQFTAKTFEDHITKWYYQTEFFKTFDMGLVAGAGVSATILKKLFFTFEFRYNYGLINISKYQIVDNGSVKTSSAEFLFGLGCKLR